ncbi:MAG: matrixin family metalloprotease [Vicingaceae bacterium]
MKKLTIFITGLLSFCLPFSLHAQCALEKITLEDRFINADLVIEGKIQSQRVFRDDSDGHIYTLNSIEVFNIFKGQINTQEVLLVTKGGALEKEGETVTPSLQFQRGNSGVLFLYDKGQKTENNEALFHPYAGPQACIHYDLIDGTAHDVFENYGNAEQELYPLLLELSKNYLKVVKKFPWDISHGKSAPNIDSISPLSTTAGTRDYINIYGNGFGSNRGNGEVEFRNASTGPTAVFPVDDEYLIWTDSLIRVEVPYRAGSGAIRVLKNGSDIIPGLVIRFAHLALGTAAYPIPALHLDNNGNGGFTWRMSNDFHSNSAARASFERALSSWSDKTCINWSNGAVTSVDQDSQDQTNNVRFADSGELETGVLAITRNYWSNCDVNTAYTVEIDLSYDPDKAWNYGSNFPSFNQYDIESISVHELGHAHQLGHVVNISDFMHATIGPGTSKRSLIDNNTEAGLHVMKLSVVKKQCGPDEMIGISNCVIPVGLEENQDNDEFSVYPNPFNGGFEVNVDFVFSGYIRIYHFNGSLLSEEMFNGPGLYRWNSTANLSDGLYLLELFSESFTARRKLLHQKL